MTKTARRRHPLGHAKTARKRIPSARVAARHGRRTSQSPDSAKRKSDDGEPGGAGDRRGDEQAGCPVRLGHRGTGHLRLLGIHLVGRLPGARSAGLRAAQLSITSSTSGVSVSGVAPIAGDLVFFDVGQGDDHGQPAPGTSGMMIDAETVDPRRQRGPGRAALTALRCRVVRAEVHRGAADIRRRRRWGSRRVRRRQSGALRVPAGPIRTPCRGTAARFGADWSNIGRWGREARGVVAANSASTSPPGRGDGGGDAGDPQAQRCGDRASGTTIPRTGPSVGLMQVKP